MKTKRWTEDQIFALVKRGYAKSGVVPAESPFECNVFGALGVMAKGVAYSSWRIADGLGFDAGWVDGVMDGFTGKKKGTRRPSLYEAGEWTIQDYRAGYSLGARCRAEFLKDN